MDSRGRMALPTRFREEAEERTENRLVATIDTNEQCLLLYSLRDWEDVQPTRGAFEHWYVRATVAKAFDWACN